MSTESPKEEASTEAARTQVELQRRLSDVALPQLSEIIAALSKQLDTNGGENRDVARVFGEARKQLGESYGEQVSSNQNLVRQQALQSGNVFSSGQVDSAINQNAVLLDRQRAQGERNLQFQEAQASLGQYNTLMNMLGQSSGTALNIGRGFAGNQIGAIGGLSNSSPFGSALGGAASGASIGSSFGGWGALIGGVAGGAAGYFGSGG